ncbi:MAG TPA: hypothetical protein VFO55_00985 [Gemmatimonadaceae bacterium]|nr:hypothetical protein [Gemmatimonadaceae bacterium]
MQSSSRSSFARPVLIGLVLVGVIAVVAMLSMRRSSGSGDSFIQRAERDMISDLRGLAAMEASTRRVAGTFVVEPDRAGHLSTLGVNPPVITLVDTGYTAVVTHKGVPELRCAIGVYAKNPLSRWAKSGEIVCRR